MPNLSTESLCVLPQVELGLHGKALCWDQGQEGSCAPCESTQHPERGAGRSLKPTEGHRPCKEDQFLVLVFPTRFSAFQRLFWSATWRLTTRFASFFQRDVFATESLSASFPKLFEGLVLIILNAKFQYHV